MRTVSLRQTPDNPLGSAVLEKGGLSMHLGLIPLITFFDFQMDFINDFFGHINHDVINHDASKLSTQEFTQYRNYFFPIKGEEKSKEEFKKSWEHHKEHNMHHWQSWTKDPINYNDPYADAFVVMMVVDWVAMGFEFGDTAQDYYEKNKDSIILPEWAIKLMQEILFVIKL